MKEVEKKRNSEALPRRLPALLYVGGLHSRRWHVVLLLSAALCSACGSPGRTTSPSELREQIAAAERRSHEPAAGSGTTAPVPAPPTTERSVRLASRIEGNTGVIDVFSPPAIGGIQLTAPHTGWPSGLQVRLHGISAMEGFTARSRFASLHCEAASSQSKDALHLCMLGATAVDAIKQTADGFEVRLPPALLRADDPMLEVRWVDRYR